MGIFMFLSRFYSWSFVVDTEGNGWYWGDSFDTPTKLATLDDRVTVIESCREAVVLLTNSGRVYHGNPLDLKQVRISTPIQSLSAGESHVVALDTDGYCWAWGSNIRGELSMVTSKRALHQSPIKGPRSNFTSVSCGFQFSVLTNSAGIWSCGDNLHGQCALGKFSPAVRQLTQVPFSVDRVKKVECTHYHTVVLDIEGNVWICGHKDKDILDSLGIETLFKNPSLTKIPKIPSMRDISVGADFILFIDYENRLWGFGNSEYGQLGTRDQ